MHKKYFFFDIDGTLAPDGTLQMPARTVQCLQKLRQNGHFTALATGRLQSNAMEFAVQHGFSTVVADGGQSVTLDGTLLYMESLPVEQCATLCDGLDKQGIPWAVNVENATIRLSRDSRFEQTAGDSYFETRLIPDLAVGQLPAVYKVFIACTPTQQGQIDLCGLPAVRFSPHCLYIEPTDKAKGIRRVMDALGAPYEDVVVFGDGTNDQNMFCPVWLSIAMGNACQALKDAADYVTGDCADSGIWDACQHFGWI